MSLRSLCLFSSLALAAATAALSGCSSHDAEAKPATAKAMSTGDDAHASCVAVQTRNRACTDAFIPALVDARAAADVPAGIAASVKQDRAAVIAQAKQEWTTDSTDAAIEQMCSRMAASLDDAGRADAKAGAGCVAKAACDEFVACEMPLLAKHLK